MPVYPQCICGSASIDVSAAYGQYPSGGYHGGLDTQHPDLKAYAPKGGTVVTAHVWQGGTSGNDSWGNYIVVQFAPGQYWLAAHFAEQIHTVGDTIAAGQFIGQQGATGYATGVHTHWEYWNGGQSTAYRADPSGILRIPNVVGTYDVTWDASGETPEPDPNPDPGSGFVFGFAGYFLHVTGDPPEFGRYPYYYTIDPDEMAGNGLGVGNTYPIYSNFVVREDGKSWFIVQDTDGQYVYTYLADGYATLDKNPGVDKKIPVWLLFKFNKGVLFS